MKLRLLPIVMVSAGALFVLKAGGLALNGHYALPAIASAQAQDAAGGAAAPEAAKPRTPAENTAPANAAEGAGKAAGEPRDERGGRIVRPGEDVIGAKAALLERLAERRQELDSRERDLLLRENLLKAAETRVAKRIEELKEIEGKIVAVAKEREDKKKARMKGLVTMYESMKPKDAARIFSQLSTTILVDLVEQMNARKMAEILADMDGDAAERLTLAIAERSQAKAEAAVPETLPKIIGAGAS